MYCPNRQMKLGLELKRGQSWKPRGDSWHHQDWCHQKAEGTGWGIDGNVMNPGNSHPLKCAEEEESQQREGAIREAGRESQVRVLL